MTFHVTHRTDDGLISNSYDGDATYRFEENGVLTIEFTESGARIRMSPAYWCEVKDVVDRTTPEVTGVVLG